MMNGRMGGSGKNVRRVLRLGMAAVLLLVVSIGMFPGNADAAAKWYDSAWKFRKQITVEYKLVAHDLVDFPMLISLPEDKELAEKAQKDADDVIFTDADGITLLSHEIEYYLPDNGQLIAWVKVPYLSAEKETAIFMYYANESAVNQQDPKGVWDKDYSLVQHLEETEGGIDFDSTSNANDGTYTGAGQGARGWIDGGDRFDGSSARVRITYSESLALAGDYTIEAWVNLATLSQWTRHIVSQRNEMYLQFNNGRFIFWVNGVGEISSVTAPASGTWYHVAVVFHRGADPWGPFTRDIYVNGVMEDSVSGGGTLTDTSNDFFLGSSSTGNYLNGSLDEVRISAAARSGEWVQTSYNNQSQPEEFYKVGEEEVPVSAPSVTTNEAFPITTTTAALNGRLTADGGEACQYRFEYDIDSGAPYAHSTPWTGSIISGQSFSAGISGLNKGTKYYFRAQVRNSAGTVSGGQLQLLTRPEPPIGGSFTAAVISGTQVDLSWEKGEAAQHTMVRVKEGSYPVDYTDGREVYFGIETSVSDTGLSPDTTYCYRAWSHVSGSDQWSETFIEITVTTGGSPPIVSVGGAVHPVDKMAILMPWFSLGAALVFTAVAGGVIYRKRAFLFGSLNRIK